ncbi:MAG: helicase-related protein, partial [archaeon]
ELAKWLDSELVESDYRPTKLKEGVLLEEEVEFNDDTTEQGDLEDLLDGYLKENKQVLVFMNARKRAEQMSHKMALLTKIVIEEKDKKVLDKVSHEVLESLESPTEQCISLSNAIKQGAAFHHAGLVGKQRELVEENFKNGKIKILCSTPTLAAGLNLPADIVIIPSLYRFEKYGMELLSVREIKQMCGRSGRPKFSTEGKSILVASSEAQKELFLEKYVHGQIEQIVSRLGIIPILRTHVLALIATNYIRNIKTIESFFEKTLYAHQLQNMGELLDNVLEIVNSLEEYKFVERKGEEFTATLLGRRVSDLFLDPESAHALVEALNARKTFTNFSYLYAWVNCAEFMPWMRPPSKARPLMMEELSERIDELPFSQEKTLYEPESTEKFFSALMLEKWINEKKEQDLFSEYGLAPGTLFGKIQIIEWLSYSTIELGKVLGQERHNIMAQKIGRRIKYGVKEELLMLVELRGVGRARARKLFAAGIKKPSEVKTNLAKVEAILGKKVADELARQLITKEEGKKNDAVEKENTAQTAL